MSFKVEVMRMLPGWILGAIILLATFKSKYKPLIRVQPKAIKFFLCFVTVLGIGRFISWKLFHQMTLIPVDMKAVQSIPWYTVLMVYWEDAVFVLPFMIFKRIVYQKKYMRLFYYATMFLMCLDFGLGHIYQSIYTGIFMMLYIPMMMEMGEEFGIGTVMICHTIFDLSMTVVTFLALRGS